MTTPYNPSTTTRPEYAEIEREIGEDPARFLYAGSVTHDGDDLGVDNIGDSPPLALAITRIRGITDLDVLEAWIEVEEELGPRQVVMKHLNQQREQLKQTQDSESPAEVNVDV